MDRPGTLICSWMSPWWWCDRAWGRRDGMGPHGDRAEGLGALKTTCGPVG
jgi:hypothetical protein